MSQYDMGMQGMGGPMPQMIPPMPSPDAMTPPSNEANIASMRWESQQIVYELYKVLGGYEVNVNADGTIKFYREGTDKPKINDDGIKSIVSMIRSVVNPSVVLSNIDDEDANELIRQLLYALMRHLVYNYKRFEIDEGDIGHIFNIVKPIVFSQVKRSVGGHESLNFHTQTLEHNIQQHSTQGQQGGGFLFWPRSKRGM